jgi:hypothetical protein
MSNMEEIILQILWQHIRLAKQTPGRFQNEDSAVRRAPVTLSSAIADQQAIKTCSVLWNKSGRRELDLCEATGGKQEWQGSNNMSKKAAEHHKKASEHHSHAARHHGEAAKHHDSGQHEKAAHHAHTAAGHAVHAREHAEEARKAHAEEYGKK